MAHTFAEDTRQTGSEDEGKEYDTSPLYPNLKFKIRDKSNVLHITIRDTKTKKIFSNTFTKSTIQSMQFHGSISKLIQMINTAKSGNCDKYQIKFEILYDNPKNNKVNIKSMSKSYKNGYCMYMVIELDEMIMSGVWPFKLFEQS